MSVGLSPFQLVDVQEVEVGKSWDQQVNFRQSGHFEACLKTHRRCQLRRPEVFTCSNLLPAADRRMHPDLIDQTQEL
ncbi:MAG: hypothetical protein BWY93_02076 [Euryarchaeota archaeon ADurb.BinA087]|nr:MAG: hypothetical protein BWY93_02076 [Euryarchaeota archaeon ADurb.BinA087]